MGPERHLHQRGDAIQGLTEVFNYDALDRLSNSTLNGSSTPSLTYNYDASGNITNRSDVGTTSHNFDYTTAQSGCNYTNLPSQPHAVRSAGAGAGSYVYCYDANGNVTARTACPCSGHRSICLRLFRQRLAAVRTTVSSRTGPIMSAKASRLLFEWH